MSAATLSAAVPTHARTSADRTVVPIEHLRAFAALSVVLFHAFGKIADAEGHLRTVHQELGAAGVDVFFVISGFIMWVSAGRAGTGPLSFWRRRLVRVVPLYWMLTTVVLATMLVAPFLLDSRTDLPHALASYLFVAWPSPSMPEHLWPIAIVGWTLNYEMYFYLLFGLALLLPVRTRLAATVLPLLCAVGLGFVVDAGPRTEFYLDPLLLEFVAGILIGRLYLSGRTIPVWICVAGIVSSIAMFAASATVVGEIPRGVLWGVPAALLTASCAFLGRAGAWPSSRFLSLLGASSYALYLSHYLALEALNKAWHVAGLPFGAGFVVAGIAFCTVGAVVVHLAVEVPVGRFLGRGRAGPLAPVGI